LASSSEDQSVRIWDVSTGRRLKTLQGYVNRIWSVAFGTIGQLSSAKAFETILVSGSDDMKVRIWNIQSGRYTKMFEGGSGRIWSVACSSVCEVSPKNYKQFVAASGDDSLIKIWEIETGREYLLTADTTSRIQSVSFSPDGKVLAGGNLDGTLRIWSFKNDDWQCSKIIPKAHRGWIVPVTFSPDNQILASAGEDMIIRLWKVGSDNLGDLIENLEGHPTEVRSISFSPAFAKTSNGFKYILATGDEDKTVRIWEFIIDASTYECTYKCLFISKAHSNRVRAVAFSPNGQILASASEDQTIQLWNVSHPSHPENKGVLQGHTSRIWSVAFSPDGNTLASCGEDEVICLWDINKLNKTPRKIRIPRPYEGMNIASVTGLNKAQKAMLRDLGAVEIPCQ
jgi:WD40 repeat protein